MPLIQMSDEVAAALGQGRAVAGLETAVVTHGLPRSILPPTLALPDAQWRREEPINLEAARAMSRAVSTAGASPAITAMIGGIPRAGLTDAEVAALARDVNAAKASSRDLGSLAESRASAGTTVAAAIRLCAAASPTPIRVFSTGGIGGVHPNWTVRPDISADLIELSRTPVCVVCAGAKSILDVPATFEALEALGVPVIGFGASHFPRFVCPPDPSLPVPHRFDSPEQIARACAAHWAAGNASAVLVVQPVDPALAVPIDSYNDAVALAQAAAERAAVSGARRTPFLLDEVARLTQGAALRANLSLLIANASLAGRIALALTLQRTQ